MPISVRKRSAFCYTMKYMRNYPFLLPKLLPVGALYEQFRLTFGKRFNHNTLTPVWYGFDKCPADTKNEKLPFESQWYHIARPLYLQEQVFYNLANALRVNRYVKGFAFIFFMGVGDYLYTTPLWGELRKRFPHAAFYGYVSQEYDRTNSPLVKGLLDSNPNFDKVFYFNGRPHPSLWKNYDYADVLKQLPAGFVAVPVYYEYGVHVLHRVNSVFETFGLPVPKEPPVPQLYFPPTPAPIVEQALQTVREKAQGKKGVVYLQLDARATAYSYPHIKQLAQGLIAAGYLVVSVSKGGPLDNPDYLELDLKQFSINQTWHLLSLIKQEFALYIICVASVSFAASAALGVPALGLQHWREAAVKHLLYPNITVLSSVKYPTVPEDKQIYAPKGTWRWAALRKNEGGFMGWVRCVLNREVDYEPDFVLHSFEEMVEPK